MKNQIINKYKNNKMKTNKLKLLYYKCNQILMILKIKMIKKFYYKRIFHYRELKIHSIISKILQNLIQRMKLKYISLIKINLKYS